MRAIHSNERVTFRHVSPSVVGVAGEVDVLTSAYLRQTLLDTNPPMNTLVVDLREVSFMDATGLGVLIGAHKRLVASGGELVIVLDQPFLERLFHLTGLHRALRFFPTVEDAQAALVPLAS